MAKVPSFKKILERAAERKGGEAALMKMMPKVPGPRALARLGDDRVLAEMAKRIFSAGFVWKVIEDKWDGFEQAFLGFDPKRLTFQPDEFWEKLTGDARIVRNAQKIMAVRDNAAFVLDIAKEHGSFSKFLAAWPPSDTAGLLEFLGKHGNRLGGATGQYFLRFVGYDAFICSADMVAALRASGLEIAETPTSKRDLKKIQERLNAWATETGLPYTHLSRILAMSIGENYSAAHLRRAPSTGQ